ncbi:hypothetical protein KP509_14G032700 [Ceratopteris richardii]|nr:hypothetical protein KP509_14G032700 [Ceratopteris richardii]
MEWAARVNSSAAPMNGGDRKRVMVVVDRSREARLAMLWALSHIVHGADILSLILFVPSSPSQHQNPMSAAAVSSASSSLSNSGGLLGRFQMPQEGRSKERKEQRSISELLASLKSLCASRRPEVEVEAMPVEGLDKGMTIVSQARKLEANVLVLGQKKRSLLQRLFNHKTPVEDVTDYCIQNAECLTLAVRKKGKHMGGYLINSRWQKNFWLLA